MMARKKLSVCVVIPAYNEAGMIGSVIKDTLSHFNTAPFNATIVVVNDGSKDHTSKIAAKNGAVVIDHVINTGAGGATMTGLTYAQKHGYDLAVTMDADGQHHPKDVRKGIDEIVKRNSDLLIGSRLINSEGMSRVKVLGNKGLTVFTAIVFGVSTSDSQSGLRVFSRNALENLKWKSTGFEFCSEMLWRAKQQKLIIDEYPIAAIYSDYSKAKGQNNWNAINIVRSILKNRILELFG